MRGTKRGRLAWQIGHTMLCIGTVYLIIAHGPRQSWGLAIVSSFWLLYGLCQSWVAWRLVEASYRTREASAAASERMRFAGEIADQALALYQEATVAFEDATKLRQSAIETLERMEGGGVGKQ